MIHVPEQWLEGVLLRADFRAFYEMERDQGKPLAVILGDVMRDGLTGLYRLAWHLTASERPAGLTLGDLLDKLPPLVDLAAMVLSLVDEAITPVCPVHEDEDSGEPQRIRWSQLQYEGCVILRQSEAEWWRSTFRRQQALLWEHARFQDPEGKFGRPMAEWEIEAANRRNMAMLGLGGGVNHLHETE